MKNLIRVLKYAKPFWKYSLLIILMISITISNSQISPWIFKKVTDQIVLSASLQLSLRDSVNTVAPFLLSLLMLQLLLVVFEKEVVVGWR